MGRVEQVCRRIVTEAGGDPNEVNSQKHWHPDAGVMVRANVPGWRAHAPYVRRVLMAYDAIRNIEATS